MPPKLAEQEYYLRLDQERKECFTIPEGWTPQYFAEDKEKSGVLPVSRMVHEALSGPKGTAPLRELVLKASHIAIIVDDGTRPTPVASILDVLLPYINGCGFDHRRVKIVVALGTHQPMTDKALKERLGRDVMEQYPVIQHNAWQNDLVPVGIPGDNRIVRINPAVAGADLRIGISSILPHPMAGFGGGPKIIVPGVSDYKFIRDHHMKHLISPHARAGLTHGNPFHEDVMKTARAIGLDYSINCIYDQNGEMIRIIGGSLDSAFSEAVAVCHDVLGHRFHEKVDITITSTYPHIHGHQFFKGLSAPDIVTKEGGAILLVAPITASISKEFLDSFRYIDEQSGGDSAAYIKDHLTMGKAYLPDKSIDYNMAMSTPFLRPNIRTILVSPMITEDEARIMRFEYASSVRGGIDLLSKSYPLATVAIFPSGGLIIPMVNW